MPKIDEDQVKRIAWLARLALPDAAMPRYAAELSSILALADELRRAPAHQLPPLAHPLEDLAAESPGPLREDVVTESDQRESHHELTAHWHADLYLVPPVIE